METLVEYLSIAAVSIAAVLIVFVVGAAIVAVVEGTGKDKISLHGGDEKQERKNNEVHQSESC